MWRECTQVAVTHLGKQSLILGYNWLHNHNLEINWQTKDVKMSRCPLEYSTCRVEDKYKAKIMEVDDFPDQHMPIRSIPHDDRRERG
jgi:hypothetical protein